MNRYLTGRARWVLFLALLAAVPLGCGGSATAPGGGGGGAAPPGAVPGFLTPALAPSGHQSMEEILEIDQTTDFPDPLPNPNPDSPDQGVPSPDGFEPPPQADPVAADDGQTFSKVATTGADSTHVVSVTHSFEALPQSFGIRPPDTHGAVGPNHIVTMLNSDVRIQDKLGNMVVPDVSLVAFFSSTGHTDVFDPKILFDFLSGRWLATADASRQSAASAAVFAISDTDDPTGMWTFYSIDADPTDTNWADFPGFGVNGTHIAITNNMFPNAGGGFVGVRMMVIDKASALAGGPLTITDFFPGFDTVGAPWGFGAFTMKPAVHRDGSSGGPLYCCARFGDIAGTKYYRISSITGPGPAAVWAPLPGGPFPGTGTRAAAFLFDFVQPAIPQLGGGFIDTGDTRISGEPKFINGRLYFAHTGGEPLGAPTTTSFLAIEMLPDTTTPYLRSWGWFFGGPNGVNYPSIAANSLGEVCAGFGFCGAGSFPGGNYVGAGPADAGPAFPVLANLKSGEDNYVLRTDLDPGPGCTPAASSRWGDYSATVLDPTDPRTFWTIQEYSKSETGLFFTDCGGGTGRWSTWWGRKSDFAAMSMSSDVDYPITAAGATANAGLNCSNPPVPPSVNAECTGTSGADITVNFSATCPSGAPFDVELYVDGVLTDSASAAGFIPGPSALAGSLNATLPLGGPYLIEVLADPGNGDTDRCQINITVVDTTAPSLTPCPADITGIECTSPAGAVVNYTAPTASDVCDSSVTVSCVPPSGSTFPIGTTNVVCTATDDSGNMDSCNFDITVEDNTPPAVTLSVSRSIIWSPRSGMIDVFFAHTAVDVCDPTPLVELAIYSSDAAGPDGTWTPGSNIVGLRAERDLASVGRIYLVVVRATDAAGNVEARCADVIVPGLLTTGGISALMSQAGIDAATCEAGNGALPAGYSTVLPFTPFP